MSAHSTRKKKGDKKTKGFFFREVVLVKRREGDREQQAGSRECIHKQKEGKRGARRARERKKTK